MQLSVKPISSTCTLTLLLYLNDLCNRHTTFMNMFNYISPYMHIHIFEIKLNCFKINMGHILEKTDNCNMWQSWNYRNVPVGHMLQRCTPKYQF